MAFTEHTLHDKIIILTGATGGLGSGIAQRLAAAGASIAMADRHQDRVSDLIEKIGGDESRFMGFPCDLNDPTQVTALVEQTAKSFGKIDGLVHSVGGFAMGDPVHEASIDVFDKMMTLNARITFLVAGAVAKHLVETNTPGSISIVGAKAAAKGSKTMAAYTASKAATIRIMESMALELRDHNIRVNTVSPSIIDTPANREAMSSADFSKWVTPEQIGDLMVFLASDAATAIIGTDIEISGRV